MGLGAGWVACGDPTIQQFVAQQLRGCADVLQGGHRVSIHYSRSRDRQGLNDVMISIHRVATGCGCGKRWGDLI